MESWVTQAAPSIKHALRMMGSAALDLGMTAPDIQEAILV